MLRWKIFRLKIVAISWLLIMCVLFFLPGSDLPKANWLDQIHFDKWVHIGLFAVLLFLWRSSFDYQVNRYGLLLLAAALIYGFMVELIQLYWVSNRSFDLYDVVADMTGSALGLWMYRTVYKKNKPL